MNNQYAVQRNKALELAKKLKWPLDEVPLAIQINELEAYLNKALAEEARRAAK